MEFFGKEIGIEGVFGLWKCIVSKFNFVVNFIWYNGFMEFIFDLKFVVISIDVRLLIL